MEKERARVSVALTGNSSTVFQPEKVPATAIGNPCSKRKPKKLAPLERKRRSVIFGAIQSNLVGRQYCIELDQKRLPISLRWAAEGCPDTYAVAYMDSSGIWQKRIQDEKYRYKMKYKQTSPYRNHSRGASGVLRALLKMRALRCHGYCPEWVFRVVLAIRVVQATQECCGPCGSFAQQRCCGQSVLQAGPSKAGRNPNLTGIFCFPFGLAGNSLHHLSSLCQ